MGQQGISPKKPHPKRISVMIVPDGGKPIRFNLATLWLKVLAGAAIVAVALILLSVISYARLFSKALERDRLIAENESLRAENRRIVALAQEVELSRKSLDRIVRSLGGELDLNQTKQAESK